MGFFQHVGANHSFYLKMIDFHTSPTDDLQMQLLDAWSVLEPSPKLPEVSEILLESKEY